jgi:hypothetical protein
MTKIGTIKLTAPAHIALVAYAILALLIILPFQLPVYNENTDRYYILQYNVWQRLLLLVFIALPISLSVYSVNCMMVGNCAVLSYVSSLMIVMWIAITVIYAFLFTFSKEYK